MDNFDPQDLHGRIVIKRPSLVTRVIGASGGAFVLCFISILASAAMNCAGVAATIVWVASLIFGAVGGFVFPRVGHFSAYGFVLFINFMLSINIGGNQREQVQLFALFALVEWIFFLARRVSSDSGLSNSLADDPRHQRLCDGGGTPAAPTTIHSND